MPRNLITDVTTRLMQVTASSAREANEQVLTNLVEHLDVDGAFLRHNDLAIKASTLDKRWPPRTDRSEPRPEVRDTSGQ